MPRESWGPLRHGARHDPIDKRSDKLANLVNALVYNVILVNTTSTSANRV